MRLLNDEPSPRRSVGAALLAEAGSVAALLAGPMRGRSRRGGVVEPRGHRAAARRGEGDDFFDYRTLNPGEPATRLDWRALARTDRAIVRQSQDRAGERWLVVLDVSRSMRYGGERASGTERQAPVNDWGGSKLWWGAVAALAVAMHGQARGDRVALGLARAADLRLIGGSTHAEVAAAGGLLAREIETESSSGSWLDGLDRWAAAGIGRAERVLVISDALDPPERLAAGHGALRGLTGGSVSLLRVLSAVELSPWNYGFPAGARVLDGEGGSRGQRRMPRHWSGYRAAMAAHDAALKRLVRSVGGCVIHARSEKSPVAGLRRWAGE